MVVVVAVIIEWFCGWLSCCYTVHSTLKWLLTIVVEVLTDVSWVCLFQNVPQVDDEGYSIRPDNPTQSILCTAWWRCNTDKWLILLCYKVLGLSLVVMHVTKQPGIELNLKYWFGNRNSVGILIERIIPNSDVSWHSGLGHNQERGNYYKIELNC